jgi:hypothetical protein
VVGKSIGIPSHLSLPDRSIPALVFVHDHADLVIRRTEPRANIRRKRRRQYDIGKALRSGRIRNSEEGYMCPVCIASTAVMVAGAGSTGGILAVCAGKFRKFFRTTCLGLFQKTKEKK